MARLEDLAVGASVAGLDPEGPAEVISAAWVGQNAVNLVYRSASGRLVDRVMFRSDESSLQLVSRTSPLSFDADGHLFRLAAEAKRIRFAALFDPHLAVHTSVVDPLPHQLIAVYDEMIHRHPLRFLLADDPGAGKTIMAGLLIKELRARGDLERCLIVCPGGLVEQWQDELDQKFQLPFDIATNDKLEAARTGNWFFETPLAIARLDKLSRDEAVQDRLKATQWDLIVVDEAHKMSANFFGNEVKYTKRHQLGQLLSKTTRHFLLMTATPHNGKEEDFQLFLSLLDGDRFEGKPRDAAHTTDCSDLMRRMVKEQLRRFDGTPLFPERKADTVAYKLSQSEAQLYKDVTEYVRNEFNRAEKLQQDGRKGTVGFALTILQRRLASSPEAIYQSLRRRRERLESRLREAELLARGGKSAFLEALRARDVTADDLAVFEDPDEFTAEQSEAAEEKIADQATAAATIGELRVEIEMLQLLEKQAMEVRRSGDDRKWDELSKLLQDQPQMFDHSGNRRKIIIFTEHRDTLNYLEQRIATLLGKPETIVSIHGSKGRDMRRNAEEAFRFDPSVTVLLATDAAGEGLNLQRAHLMVNYDLPWNPNRLEQRFGRIHRIGQEEVCHCWNLVATETREGDVYRRLLEKVEAQREALGGRDAVFDVLGRLIEGNSLRDLLIEAIRYGDDKDVQSRLTQAVDMATETEHIRKLLDTDALVRDAMDTSRIETLREDMQRAEAKRLQPHYIEAWFRDAFTRLGGRISPREKGRFEITRVPGVVRARDRQLGQGAPVLPRYERATFEKKRIHQHGSPEAAFIAPGHPLLDAALDVTLERHTTLLKHGATLVDLADASQDLRLLFVLDHRVRDGIQIASGDQRDISRQLQFVTMHADGSFAPAGAAPYLDLRPLEETERQAITDALRPDWLAGDNLENRAITYAAEHLVPEHLESVKTRRDELLTKTREAVRIRLNREIQYWDHRAQEIKAQEQAGRTPNLNSANAQARADELEARLNKRLVEIDRQRQLSAAAPRVIGAALVVPQGLLDSHRSAKSTTAFDHITPDRRAEIDRLAVDAVLAAERRLGRQPREMPHHHEGYDIESTDPAEPGRVRFIEVKGKAVGRDTVTVSASQIRTCCNTPDDWILAVVPIDGVTADEPRYAYGFFPEPPTFAHASVNVPLRDILSVTKPPH